MKLPNLSHFVLLLKLHCLLSALAVLLINGSFFALVYAQESPTSLAAGKKVFSERCAVCHGSNARGGEYGPPLVGDEDLRGKPVSWFRNLIRSGVPSAGMPAFDLSASELDAVATLVHSFNALAFEEKLPGDRAAGKKYFFGKGGCASCHMVNGRGSATGPDLSGIGLRVTVAELRASLLQPGVSTRQGYSTATVALGNGETIRGFARNQNNFELALQDMEGKFHLLHQSEISKITYDQNSVMPAMDSASPELPDLLAYLSGLAGVKPGTTEAISSTESTGLPFSRVLHPQTGDWPTYNGNLSGNRYSELNEINTANVNQLQLKWIYTVPLWQQFYPDTPYFQQNLQYFGLETTPLVVDGIMYGTGPQQAYALDARTGHLIWKYSRRLTSGLFGDASLGSNRGVAILGDKLFMTTNDAHLIALNRITGQLVWEVVMPEKPMHYGATMAPLVVKDMVIGGVSGGDWGIRGFVAAYNASDGKLRWRRWTIPDQSEPEAKTWGKVVPEDGGAGTWVTGSYDPETDTLYWTTGNPYPDDNDKNRPGDNLYSNCILALDADTGKIKWFYQVTPHDVYDWDSTAPLLVVDAAYQGEQRKLLLYSNKNGFFYVFDRTNGYILVAKPFVDLNWASGIGPDGRPVLLPKTGMVCPDAGTNWGSSAFSPQTQFYYVMANDKCFIDMSVVNEQAKERPAQKYLEAIDIQNGQVQWKVPQIGPVDGKRNAGILATSSGLVFYGDPTGDVIAADARTGNTLWHFPTNGEAKASPMTYMADGKQFIAIAVGPNILAFGLP